MTILYVTHDQEEALRLSDRIALFNAGRFEQLGTGHDLYEQPVSRFVAGFIGNSNFLDGKLARADRSIVLPNGPAITGVALDEVGPSQGDVSIMIRHDPAGLFPPARRT